MLKKALIIGIVLFINLRIPSLFENFHDNDEAIYTVIGMVLNRGGLLYRDIWENKPPLFYIFYQFADIFNGYSLLVIKLLNLSSGLASILIIYNIIKDKINTKIAVIVLFVSIFIFNLRSFEYNIANSENFFTLFTLIGLLIFTKLKSNKGIFLTGLFFGIASIMKVNVLPEILVFTLYLITNNLGKELKLKSTLLYILGSIIPWILVFMQQYLLGTFKDFFDAQTSGFTYVKASDSSSLIYSFGFRFILFILSILIILFLMYRKKISKDVGLIILLFSASIFSALLSGRPYNHYAIQVIPYGLILLGYILAKENRKEVYKWLVVLFVVFISTTLLFFKGRIPLKGEIKSSGGHYYLFFKALFTDQDFQKYPRADAKRLYTLAELMMKKYVGKKKYFVITRVGIYKMIDELPLVNRVPYYHTYFNADLQKDLIDQLIKNKVDLIVVDKAETLKEEFEKYLKANYILDTSEKVEGYEIYTKLDAVGIEPTSKR